MKKIVLSIAILMCFCNLQAQITINSTNVVDVNNFVEQAKDTIPVSLNIGSGGSNQTWDFSTLIEHKLDTMFFENPTPLPGSAAFPLANIGMVDTSKDSTWIYLTKNSSGLFSDGVAMYQNGNLITTESGGAILLFPSTMGTNFSGSWNVELFRIFIGVDPDGPGPLPTIDSVKITRSAYTTNNMDGWGNVITPFGTFASLRQNIYEEDIDTTWTLSVGVWTVIDPILAGLYGITPVAYDTIRTARWWTDDPVSKFPVVEMDYNVGGSVNNAAWQKSSPTVGVENIHKETNEVTLYPNPACDYITIESSLENNNLKIFDITGKMVSESRFFDKKFTLSVKDFDSGMYFYKIYDSTGNVFSMSKFVVIR